MMLNRREPITIQDIKIAKNKTEVEKRKEKPKKPPVLSLVRVI
jgi:hypothetical protein